MRRERRATERWRAWWPTSLSLRLGLHGRIAVQRARLSLPRWRGPSLRLVFASDFHAGPTTHPRHIAAACDRIAEAEPDLLLLGGDFAQEDAADTGSLAWRLGQVRAPLGRFAVLGNHDHLSGEEGVAARLRMVGINVLENRPVQLAAPHQGVWVCGLGDWDEGSPDPTQAFEGADGVRIVLMHSPETLLALAGHQFDLALCGHTHGGQVALPGGTPIVMPGGWLNRRFSQGLHRLNEGGLLLVSRGIGFSRWPIRLFARSEIHVLELGA